MAGDAACTDVDLFRETPLRLLGYANELGEAFRSMIPKSWVASSYVIASLYAVSDASDKAYKSYKKDHHVESIKYRKSLEVFFEAALWQALASVVIPGFTINRICRLSNISLSKIAPALRTVTRNKMTTAIGLGCIPLIVKPIDRFVDCAMEQIVPLAKQILQQEAVIEESLHIAVESHKEAFGDLQR